MPHLNEANDYAAIFLGMSEVAAIHDLVRDEAGRPIDYRIVDCNPAFSEVTGIPRERAIGALASELYGTGNAPFLDVYARVATTGTPERFESFFAPMKKHFVVSVMSPRPGSFVTVSYDVTDLRQTTAELQLDERRLQALADLSVKVFDDERALIAYALEEAVRITDSEIGYFHFLEHDETSIELYAWSTRALEQCSKPQESHYPVDRAGIWADAARLRRPVFHNDFPAAPGRRGLPEGHSPLTRHMSCPILDRDRVVAIAGVANKPAAYDAHDARQLLLFFDGVWRRIVRFRFEEERRKLDLQVQHAQKLESLGVLAGGIAHDFNNLLAAILGNVDVAMSELAPMAPARETLEDAQRAALRAAELVKQMLAYSGRGRFVIQPIDLRALIEEMGHILQVSISKQAVLRFNFAPGLPSVQGDAAQFRQIVMNLIINASDAIEGRSGVITVSTGAMDCDRAYLADVWVDDQLTPGQYVYVEVCDTGCGMDGETRAKIFDPFFTTKSAGRGLGLSAVLGIVRGHKGAIKVYSEPGKGTTFKVLFPASGQPAAKLGDEASAAGWRGTGLVLLVDDEETVRSMGRRMLQALGFEVVTASDGQEALSIFRSRKEEFACVILDLVMPHLNGEETYRELRRLKPDQRVVMTSGYSEHEVGERFAGKGMAGFVQKPYQMSILASVLKTALAAPP